MYSAGRTRQESEVRTSNSQTADCGVAAGLLAMADAVNTRCCQASNPGGLTLELELLATPLNCPVEIGICGVEMGREE